MPRIDFGRPLICVWHVIRDEGRGERSQEDTDGDHVMLIKLDRFVSNVNDLGPNGVRDPGTAYYRASAQSDRRRFPCSDHQTKTTTVVANSASTRDQFFVGRTSNAVCRFPRPLPSSAMASGAQRGGEVDPIPHLLHENLRPPNILGRASLIPSIGHGSPAVGAALYRDQARWKKM